MVVNLLTIHPDQTLSRRHRADEHPPHQGIPVVERDTNRLVGIITHRDVRFATDLARVYELMTRKGLVTVTNGASPEQAATRHEHRIEKLLVVDEDYAASG
jgi:IMP dehydrogenase